MTTKPTAPDKSRYESYVRYCNEHSLPVPSFEEYAVMEEEELRRQGAIEDAAREGGWDA